MRWGAVLLVVAGALAAPNHDGWRQLWKRSPTDFATHASEKLHATLDRLLQGPRVRSRAPRKATDDTGALQLLLQIWHKRDDPTYLLELVERLALLVQDDRGVDELEVYLPQIGHLLLRLPSDSLLATVLERFALRVSETNVHWALQLIWTVYANLEENRPERLHADAEVFARSSRLLQLIEQSVVYGAKMVNRDRLRAAALTRNVQIWIDQLQASYGEHAGKAEDEPLQRRGLLQEEGRSASLPPPSAATGGRAAPLRAQRGSAAHLDTGAAAAAAEAGALIEGWLVKRKARDSWGLWRCFGESWAYRWFSMRNNVLYYYRRRSDRQPRGAMPLGQCRIELRPSTPGGGPYIKVSARFTHAIIRLRGATDAETARWLHALRASAGLAPLGYASSPAFAAAIAEPAAATAPDAPQFSAAYETQMLAAAAAAPRAPADTGATATGSTGATGANSEPPQPQLPPLGILDEYVNADLTMSQRCSYLYLLAQRDFVRALAALSEALYTPGGTGLGTNALQPQPAAARRKLEAMLHVLRDEVQPLAYVPLSRSSDVFAPVVRIPAGEASVFVTRARASVLLYLETAANPRRRKLSQLFEAVRVERPEKAFDDLGVRRTAVTQARLGRRTEHKRKSPLELFSWGADDDELPAEIAAATLATQPATSSSAASPSGALSPEPSSLSFSPSSFFRASAPPAAPPHALHPATPTPASLDEVYGEAWPAKVARLKRSSPLGREPGWGLTALISKANDDVRQEAFVMQLIRVLHDAMPAPLWLRPYHILSTGPRSGLIEMVTDTKSIDQLKRRRGYTSLRAHFETHYGPPTSSTFLEAQANFAASLAAYSVVCYVLAIKDRHNGNLLLDRQGHLIHIDFGFVMGGAPGGPASFACPERGVPFKLTREMVMVLGGKHAPLYRQTFSELCVAAMRAARAHGQALLSLCEMTAYRSALPCFAAGGASPVQQMRERLMLDVPEEQLAARVQGLIDRSYDSSGTAAYDLYQQMSNGIRQ